MENSLSRAFTARSLLVFALPTMVMMLFMSLYTMVDGVFVARFAGTAALSAVNIVYPLVNVVIAVGVMLAAGGSAVVAKKLGEGHTDGARADFTLIILAGAVIGTAILALGLAFLDPILRLLGASDAIFDLCRDYGRAMLLFAPACVLMMLFQTLFVTSGKPKLGLIVTILGGLLNIVLDYVFIVPLGLGIAGAGYATGIGYSVPALFGLVYFFVKRKGTLFFVRPSFSGRTLAQSCSNGSSEAVTQLSTAVTTFLFNILMMRYAGEDGVASITIVLYAQYLLTALYLGYATGTAPVVSFNFGMGDRPRLRALLRISLVFVAVGSLITFALALLLAKQIVLIFADRGTAVFDMSVYGFRIFAFSFLFDGLSIYVSSFFTALSDGKTSAAISFLRTFVFIVLALFTLPAAIGLDGIWLAIPAAEFLGAICSAAFLFANRRKYEYM